MKILLFLEPGVPLNFLSLVSYESLMENFQNSVQKSEPKMIMCGFLETDIFARALT